MPDNGQTLVRAIAYCGDLLGNVDSPGNSAIVILAAGHEQRLRIR